MPPPVFLSVGFMNFYGLSKRHFVVLTILLLMSGSARFDPFFCPFTAVPVRHYFYSATVACAQFQMNSSSRDGGRTRRNIDVLSTPPETRVTTAIGTMQEQGIARKINIEN